MGFMSFIYTRMLRAKPFQSDSFDQLAKIMNVTKILKKEKMNRYYNRPKSIRGCEAFFDVIIFDARYYDSLSSEERLAIGAHEFNHILQNHNLENVKHQILPGLLIGSLLAFLTVIFDSFIYSFTSNLSGLIILCGCILSLSCVVFMFASLYLNGERLRQTEKESDLSAVKFANGEALISALTKLYKIYPKKPSRFDPKTHPTFEERVDYIRRAMD